MGQAYYFASIEEFKNAKTDAVLGQLLINDVFTTTDLQKNAWRSEINILQTQLSFLFDGDIAFEYTIPRIGHRVDVVLIINGIIFLFEFKVGDNEYKKSTEDQVMDYALDLKYFHQASKDKYIVPIIVSTDADDEMEDISVSVMDDNITGVIHCNQNNIKNAIEKILKLLPGNTMRMKDWIDSKYAPTPTIIEAAQALYRNHSIADISRNEAGADNLTKTTEEINKIIEECKNKKKKAICFITGVPGAGKTLAGLNIANSRHHFDTNEHAVFLSGNAPLVEVLQTALAKDKANRDGVSLSEAKRETTAFIQIIHKFRDEALANKEPPTEKVAIFDEAQRAWDEKTLTDFMCKKKNVPNFNQSEPEFLISIMDRHTDWATIVCLVGGGQEINKGEAGIKDWFMVLKERFSDWEIFLSDRINDFEYVGTSTVEQLLAGRDYNVIPDLHLGVSLRSFRSECLSDFVKELLDNKEEAKDIYQKLSESYPIVMTRDFETAKKWIKSKARGKERYGLLASSEGKRLRAVGIWVLSAINHIGWFLNEKDNIASSYYLEVAASEFKVQGLEIDYALLAWDADFRYENDQFKYYHYRGNSWNTIHSEQIKRNLKNAYRVLLTRARQGMVIFIPVGNDEDPSRKTSYYDGVYNYLKRVGVEEI